MVDQQVLLCPFRLEQNVDGNPVGRLNYYDIPLKTDKEYTQSLDGDDITADSNDAVISKDSTITPSEYLSVSDDANITVESAETDGGTVVGTGIYPLGDPVSLTAYPENGYKFAGWYMDGELRDLSSVYRFTARENVDIEAKFVIYIVGGIMNMDKLEMGQQTIS